MCGSKDEVHAFIRSKNGTDIFNQHRHYIFDVFLPVLVVGTFPSFILCIFIRLVVLLTPHDHFLSAYVMNIVSMSLQIMIAPLAIHIATYHFGPTGFSCWYCIVEDNDRCPLNNLHWRTDHIGPTLAVTLATKLLDSVAGAIMIFVVVCRRLWERSRNKMVWWYMGRAVLTLISFVLCIVTSPVMILTPAIAIFRKELLEKLGLDSTWFLSLFIVGVSLWSATVLVIALFITYRTYIYCRVEDLTEQAFHHFELVAFGRPENRRD